MNLTQMHEHLRLELLRRIQRGTVSISLLARQTGFGPSHLSNFLRSKRRLSLRAMDRILAAQQMTVADLLPAERQMRWREGDLARRVPVVSHATALHEPLLRPSAIQRLLHVPESLLGNAPERSGPVRKAWTRFVAIDLDAEDAAAMEPLILPDALAVLDRHYNVLAQYRPGRRNLYAVRLESRLVVRYAEFQAGRLVLRPQLGDAPVTLVEMTGDESPSDLIAGRVVALLNQP